MGASFCFVKTCSCTMTLLDNPCNEKDTIILMSKQKLGRDRYYINIALFNLLSNMHEKLIFLYIL